MTVKIYKKFLIYIYYDELEYSAMDFQLHLVLKRISN